MEIKQVIFKKNSCVNSLEYQEVVEIANNLISYMNSEEIQKKIESKHITHAKSSEIQEVILPKALELGFTSEKTKLFESYQNSGLRPDYYKKIDGSHGSGILMEVERGKTTINNMDLLDIWKCHICNEANYLFLIIPQYRMTGKGKNTPVFPIVEKRISSFFIENNYLNIDAIFLIGY
jgi:hypothetical protein